LKSPDRFVINTCEIWEFHYKEFFKKNIKEETLVNLTEKLSLVIYNEFKNSNKNVLPFASQKMVDDNSIKKDYYQRHLKEHFDNSSKKWSEQIENVPYFDTKDGFFDYDQDITIGLEHYYFEYFFALKLNLLQLKLFEIPIYLNHLSLKKYDKDISETISFLETTLKQYKLSIHSNVFEECKKWIKKKKTDPTPEENAEKFPKTKYRTFYLELFNTNKTFLNVKESAYGHRIHTSYLDHIKGKLVKEDLEFKCFSKIFSEANIDEKDKIEVNVTLFDLKSIIEILDKSEIIKEFENGNDKWKIGVLCFSLKYKNKRSAVLENFKQISDANGKKSLKVDHFTKFINDLESEVKRCLIDLKKKEKNNTQTKP